MKDNYPTISYYVTLDIPQSSTEDEIKQAYRAMALKHHPDKVDSSELESATIQMQKINAAYECLGDENLRSKYDAYLSKPTSTSPSNTTDSKPTAWGPSTSNETPPKPERSHQPKPAPTRPKTTRRERRARRKKEFTMPRYRSNDPARRKAFYRQNVEGKNPRNNAARLPTRSQNWIDWDLEYEPGTLASFGPELEFDRFEKYPDGWVEERIESEEDLLEVVNKYLEEFIDSNEQIEDANEFFLFFSEQFPSIETGPYASKYTHWNDVALETQTLEERYLAEDEELAAWLKRAKKDLKAGRMFVDITVQDPRTITRPQRGCYKQLWQNEYWYRLAHSTYNPRTRVRTYLTDEELQKVANKEKKRRRRAARREAARAAREAEAARAQEHSSRAKTSRQSPCTLEAPPQAATMPWQRSQEAKKNASIFPWQRQSSPSEDREPESIPAHASRPKPSTSNKQESVAKFKSCARVSEARENIRKTRFDIAERRVFMGREEVSERTAALKIPTGILTKCRPSLVAKEVAAGKRITKFASRKSTRACRSALC